MFILILTLVGTLMQGYLLWRIASLPWFDRPSRRKNLWLSALSLWLFYVLGSVYGHDGSGMAASWLERLAMDWLGGVFIAATLMFGIDLATGFGLWARRYAAWLRGGILPVAAVLIGVALVQGGRAPAVTRYQVVLDELPQALNGTTVAIMSDLHLGAQLGADWLAARIAQVEALEPDLIVLLGDIFEGHGRPVPQLIAPFYRLEAPLGVYAVTGNHEFMGDSDAAVTMTEKAGVVWLRDHWHQAAPGLLLVGVDDLTARRYRDDSVGIVSRILQARPAGAAILLSHTAWQAEEAAAVGIGLMLSGHNHGGQIWPFGYLVRYFYPLFAGRYEVRGMTVIVSRGTGLWGPRMRLWRRGEIIEVTLRQDGIPVPGG